MLIYGIDAGSEKSGVCLWDTKEQKILYANDAELNKNVPFFADCDYPEFFGQSSEFGEKLKAVHFVIEDIKSYGMPVGKTTFDTCKAIGRFQERLERKSSDYHLVFKPEIQIHFCNTSRAKDANIKRVLLDRFGGKGTKKNQGILYPLKNHSWDAFALCIYLEDKLKGE